MNPRRRVALPTTVLVGAIAVALGSWGYSRADPDLGASDALYRGIQLLTLNYDGPIRPPWQLEVGRYLAALTLALAVIAVAAAFARNRVERLRIRLTARGHHVVVGLGARGRTVVSRLEADGAAVVAVDADPTGEGTVSAQARGLPVIVGDVQDGRTYRDAAASRAKHVFIALGDDSANLEALEACVSEVRGPGPTLHVAIDGHSLWRELHRSALAWSGAGGAIEFVSLPDRVGARMAEEAETSLASGRIIVWGAGPKAARTAAHAARRVLLAGGAAELVLGGPHAEALAAELQQTESWIAAGAGLEVVSDPTGTGPAAAFVVGLPHADALAAGSALAKGLDRAVILVEVPRGGSVEALRRSGYPLDRVKLVDAEAQELGPALFEHSARDLIARAKHGDHVTRGLERGETPEQNPSLRPWGELPESLRESNRLFADSVGERLADLGARLEPLSGPVRPPTISPAVMEELARVEHDRWMNDLLSQGWRYRDGPKDPDRKLHPMLVEWEQVDEPNREKDRDSIRALPMLLARVGYELRIDADSKQS